MNALILAFITGLTTGGLSCLAVQGGLLAGSLANQVEQDVRLAATKTQTAKSHRREMPSSQTASQTAKQPASQTAKQSASQTAKQSALSILLFLSAKLLAYTLLGLLLGWLGSLLQLNAMLRALLILVIGIFMIGNALRMLDVHPIFRNFVIEPPAAFRRYLRRTAKNGTELGTPLFLGFLTVLIPCGVTQAMMAAAMATGNALEGAALMFAFTLGTSPVFFFVAYLATQLGARLEKWFMRFVAVVVLILGLVSVNSGLTLMGSPLAVSHWLPIRPAPEVRGPTAPVGDATAPVGDATAPVGDATALTINVANDGYSPYTSHAQARVAVTLNLVTENTMSCSRAFVIPSLGVEEILPRTGSVSVDIPPQEPGTVLRYSCSMGMYDGEIVFDVEN